MVAPVPVLTPEQSKSRVFRSATFAAHIAAVYLCAVFFSSWLVRLGFQLARWAGSPPSIGPIDWTLQHFELVYIVPALVVGYVNVRRSESLGKWVWTVPAAVMVYKLLRYQPSASSVLYTSGIS